MENINIFHKFTYNTNYGDGNMRKSKIDFELVECIINTKADLNIVNEQTYYLGDLPIDSRLWLEAHALGVDSCWIHRAKEEFESEEGREILKSLGIEGDYEGIGHCILGYVDGEEPQCHQRKDNWVYRA